MKIKQKQIISLGLSLLGIVGNVGTFIFAIKETKKAMENKESTKPEQTKMKKVVKFVKDYKMSLIFATASISSNIVSKIMSVKTEASLLSTIALLDTGARKYKNKVKEKLGIDFDKEIKKELMKTESIPSDIKPKEGEQLYYEEHIGYFYAIPEKLREAYAMMNEDLSGNVSWYYSGRDCPGWFTVKEFLKLCEGRPLSHNLDDAALNFGWSFDFLIEFWEYSWVHMDVAEPDENGVRMIYWFEEPIWNPAEWFDFVHEGLTREEYFTGYKGPKAALDNQYYVKESK